jgi:hypothetical protein
VIELNGTEPVFLILITLSAVSPGTKLLTGAVTVLVLPAVSVTVAALRLAPDSVTMEFQFENPLVATPRPATKTTLAEPAAIATFIFFSTRAPLSRLSPAPHENYNKKFNFFQDPTKYL